MTARNPAKFNVSLELRSVKIVTAAAFNTFYIFMAVLQHSALLTWNESFFFNREAVTLSHKAKTRVNRDRGV